MNTANTVRIAAIVSALVLSVAVNGTTLMAFDHLAKTAATAKTVVNSVALHTVTITAKRV